MQKIKEKIEYLGLSFKKELMNFIIVNSLLLLLGIASFFVLDSFTYSGYSLALMFLFSLFYVTRYGKQIDAINTLNLEEFSNLFSYFKIYLHNGFSVYTSLKEIVSYSNSTLKKLLETLINEIDEDKTVQPFIKFAKNFNEVIVEEMMISIYQMIDDGESSDYLIQFELIFDKFSELMYQRNLKRKDSKLATLSSSALIGSCYLMVVMTIGIISIIGEMVNGL